MNLQSISKRLMLSRDARASFFLNRSIKSFEKTRAEYWQEIHRDRNLTPHKDWFDAIDRDGICIIPDYLDAATVSELQREVEAVLGFMDGTYEGPVRTHHLKADGILGMEVTEQLPISYRLTRANHQLDALARALYGDKIKLSGVALLNKYNPDRIDSSNVPHWDDWRVRFKAFLYIYDVGPENAPTVYVKGSQGDRVPWRIQKDYASKFLPSASAGGSWWPVEQLGLEKILCIGKAGTLVLFDALGIHAGTQLTGRQRVMLMSMYTTHIPYNFRVY